MMCCACIGQGDAGIIEELGKFKDVIPPGLTTLNPCTQSVAGVVSLRLRTMQCVVHSTTSEKTSVAARVTIMYRAIPSLVHTAFYSLSDPEEQIKSFVENALRGELPSHTLDKLFVMKNEIAHKAMIDLAQRLNQYGFEVIDLLILEFDPARDVVAAMNQQTIQRYQREVAQVKGSITRMESIMEAEAEAEAKRLSGVGAAEMNKGVSGGLGSALQQFNAGDQSSAVMAMVLMEHYLAMMEEIAHAEGNHTYLVGNSVAPMASCVVKRR